jgi:hypothetical protein
VQGELGHGYKLVQEKPAKITKVPSGIRFKAVAAGHEHSLALTGTTEKSTLE